MSDQQIGALLEADPGAGERPPIDDPAASNGRVNRPPKLLTIADLAQLPPPRFLVSDLLRAEGLNVLFGPSGSGKTFLMLDLALCVAYGKTWWGLAVEEGSVLYVAAEGASGLHVRVDAWKQARGIETDTERFRVLPEAVNLYMGDTARLEAALEDWGAKPDLIVFDTLARCMVGGDENSARDVGQAIETLDRLGDQYAAASATVHHTGKGGELERGSSALRGAADTMIALRPDGDVLKLTCEKQKDAAEFSPWHLGLVPGGESVSLAPETQAASLTSAERLILVAVSEAFETQRFSPTKAIEASEAPKASVYRALKRLCGEGLLVEHKLSERRAEYEVTPLGQDKVSESLNESHETGSPESHVSPSLRTET